MQHIDFAREISIKIQKSLEKQIFTREKYFDTKHTRRFTRFGTHEYGSVVQAAASKEAFHVQLPHN